MHTSPEMISSEPPELLSRLLNSAIEYNEPEDRYLALAAANYHDSLNGTNFGRLVVSTLMQNAGLHYFDPAVDEKKVYPGAIAVKPEVAKAVREVYVALGPQNGANVLIVEEIVGSPGIARILKDEAEIIRPVREIEKEYGLRTGELLMSRLTIERPYYIAVQGSESGKANLFRAIQAFTRQSK